MSIYGDGFQISLLFNSLNPVSSNQFLKQGYTDVSVSPFQELFLKNEETRSWWRRVMCFTFPVMWHDLRRMFFLVLPVLLSISLWKFSLTNTGVRLWYTSCLVSPIDQKFWLQGIFQSKQQCLLYQIIVKSLGWLGHGAFSPFDSFPLIFYCDMVYQ